MKRSKLVANTQIYLDCRKLMDEILDVTPNFPRAYKYTIGARMQEISVDLLTEIAAAYINRDRHVRIQHLVDFQTSFVAAVRRLNRAETVQDIEHAVSSINSYLGCLRHANEYNMRKKVLGFIDRRCYKWVYIKGHYDSVAIIKKYRQRYRTLQRIRDGTY